MDKLGACLLATTSAMGLLVGWQEPLPQGARARACAPGLSRHV